ncbi:MAG: ABC transporter permease [Chloroflexi bacterium]|nr:ABC transporter permease [Chloroflexota bacterium]
MQTFILRRIIQSVVVLIIISFIVFSIMRLLPGDPIIIYLSQSQMDSYSPEQLTMLRHEFGLDKPFILQYFDWAYDILRGDLGMSIFKREPVADIVARRLPITMHLGVLSLILSVVVGMFMGIIAALRRGSKLDTGSTLLANLGITMPSFWLGILMIYFFGLYLRWLPIYGYTSPFTDFVLSTRQVVMPVIALSVFSVASIARQTRSSMLEVVRQDYVRTAWAKGLRERTIIMRHAMKNGLIPVVTLVGTHVRYIVGGAVLIETVFNIPGMGRLAVDGILDQDYAVVQGVVLIIAMVVTIANIIVDISYGWLDPRVRRG